MRRLILLTICVCVLFASRPSRANDVRLTPDQLTPGTRIDLTGTWLYKPGYDKSEGDAGFVPVPVPQILNRIHWWLDDSEDFKKDEEARLKKLGFDTEKAEDGWYRKTIVLPESGIPKGTRLFVQFDGVAMRSDVHINGTKLGHHDGMFSRFEYDLTPHVKPGRNTLRVFVSMEKIPPTDVSLGEAVTVNLTASKILSMSKGMFGPLSPGHDNRAYDLHGIWQPVRLAVVGEARIADVWFKPKLDSAEIDVEVKNTGPVREIRVRGTVTDPATGTKLGEMMLNTPSDTGKVPLSIGKVSPKLWTPADPNLYRLDVTLEDAGGEVLDKWSKKVGFRTFEAKGDQLLLNGKPYFIRGANQLPYGKNPTDPALARKLMQHLHDSNIRVTRTHCTPWNEAWLDAADDIGLGVSVEGIRPWALVGKIGPTPPEMMKHWLMEQEDVIRRIRNHPSVLIHTIGNEMTLRDDDNVEKWTQLTDVTKLTRALDPFRPIVVSSTYVREEKQYEKLFKPNGIDDGDVDDAHNYSGWYSDSPFIVDSTYKDVVKRRGDVTRPFIGQEQSTGYPDLDNGLPVLRYTRDLVTPQAWVGVYAYPGNDPAYFLEYNRAVTKRWAEQLRFQRGVAGTDGFSLFSLECWFSHGYDASRVKPYPVMEAVKQAYAPVGVALESARRRFYSNETFDTAVFVTNDDEQQRDHRGVRVDLQVAHAQSGKVATAWLNPDPQDVAYYATVRVPAKATMPEVKSGRARFNLISRLITADNKEVSRTVDPIEVFARPATPDVAVPAGVHVIGDVLKTLPTSTGTATTVTLVAPGTKSDQLDGILAQLESEGGTTILFAPEMAEMLKRFPNDIVDDARVAEADFEKRVADAKAKKQDPPRRPQAGFAYNAKRDLGEFADWTPARGTTLVQGLEPMDLRWWGRQGDWRAYVSTGSFRLKPDGKGRELIRYIPAHSYIPAERVPWQYRTVLFELPVGTKGRLWVCNLDLDTARGVDPVADIVARNLLIAAADPSSTAKLKRMPSHEEMLKGKLPR